MKSLAAFIMRGRLSAAVVALAGNWVPLLSPATVGLVTLRAGARDGSLIVLCAVLPALASLAFSQMSPLLPLLVMGSSLVAFGLSVVLRQNASWPHALMAMVALSTALALAIGQLSTAAMATGLELLEQWREQIGEGGETPAPVDSAGEGFVTGMMAYVMAFIGVLGTIVGRWWQALLYNPGGFREEFHQLRLNTVQALVCLGAGVYCLTQPLDTRIWAALFTLPLLLVGLAIVHRLFAVKRWSTHWLVLFYIALVLLGPVTQALILVAFMDTWLNFRARFKAPS